MVRYKRLTIPFKILAFSILITLFLESLSEFSAISYGNNRLIAHFQGVIPYLFHAVVFYYLFKNNLLKKIALFSICFALIFGVINAMILQSPHGNFPTYTYLLTNGFRVLFCLLFFRQMLQYPLDLDITKQSVFWLNTAILLFSATMFLNMGFTNYYATHRWGKDIIFYLWFINDCLFVVLIGISLFTDNKKTAVQNG